MKNNYAYQKAHKPRECFDWKRLRSILFLGFFLCNGSAQKVCLKDSYDTCWHFGMGCNTYMGSPP